MGTQACSQAVSQLARQDLFAKYEGEIEDSHAESLLHWLAGRRVGRLAEAGTQALHSADSRCSGQQVSMKVGGFCHPPLDLLHLLACPHACLHIRHSWTNRPKPARQAIQSASQQAFKPASRLVDVQCQPCPSVPLSLSPLSLPLPPFPPSPLPHLCLPSAPSPTGVVNEPANSPY